MEKHGGVRPRNPKSRHCSLSPESLKGFEDRWELLADKKAA